MNIKISEMPQATTLSGDETIPIVQSGVSKKTDINSINNVRPYIAVRFGNNQAIALPNWSGSPTVMPFSTENYHRGNAFTFDSTNHTITVGSGVSAVKFTLVIGHDEVSGEASFSVRKNGTDVRNGIFVGTNSTNTSIIRQESTFGFIEVTNGDVIDVTGIGLGKTMNFRTTTTFYLEAI